MRERRMMDEKLGCAGIVSHLDESLVLLGFMVILISIMLIVRYVGSRM